MARHIILQFAFTVYDQAHYPSIAFTVYGQARYPSIALVYGQVHYRSLTNKLLWRIVLVVVKYKKNTTNLNTEFK